MKVLKSIKETFLSSLPLAVIIIICLLAAPFKNTGDYLKIIIGYVSVIVGQALFLVGLDRSILPIGHLVGTSLSKCKKVFLIILKNVLN